MQNYKESVAYNFELFAPKEKTSEKENNVVAIPAAKTRAKNSTKAAAKPAARKAAGVTLCAAMALMMIFLRVYGEVQNAEVMEDINRTKATIETLKSEETRLQMELESAVTFTNVEKAAKELGMQKRDAAQTTYVMLSDEDNAEIVGGEEEQNLFQKLANLF